MNKNIMKIKLLIIGMMIFLSCKTKRDKKQFEFNKIEVVFNNSTDTITYKNVTIYNNWYVLKNDSKININNIKYVKEYKNSEFEKDNIVLNLNIILLIIIFISFIIKIFM